MVGLGRYVKRAILAAALVAGSILTPAGTFAGSDLIAHTGPLSGPLFGDAVPPTVGAALWCGMDGREPFCHGVAEYKPIRLDDAMAEEITKINLAVNKDIEPVDDVIQWHVPEKWSRPARGADGHLQDDCDGYVIEKWYRLVQEHGLPAGAFYPLYAEVPGYGGHLVLALLTDKGTYVLDNLHDDIVLLKEFSFTYLKRPRAGTRLDDTWERYVAMG